MGSLINVADTVRFFGQFGLYQGDTVVTVQSVDRTPTSYSITLAFDQAVGDNNAGGGGTFSGTYSASAVPQVDGTLLWNGTIQEQTQGGAESVITTTVTITGNLVKM